MRAVSHPFRRLVLPAGAQLGAARPGVVLALLTWRQRADPNWFGASIPDVLQSLELLRTGSAGAGHPALTYQCFAGKDLLVVAKCSQQGGLETDGGDPQRGALRPRQMRGFRFRLISPRYASS